MLGELSLWKNPAGDTEIKLRKDKNENEKEDNLKEAEKSLVLLSWHGHWADVTLTVNDVYFIPIE